MTIAQDRPKRGGNKKAKKSSRSTCMLDRYTDADPDFTERIAAGGTSHGMFNAAAIQRQREAEAQRAIDEFDRKWAEASRGSHG
ncbi:hypothetical protein PG985_003463 [Apiospora marii]|uniref:Uncharacterized protein n=1 Tax=Apiospora marii TaxID=335849 RepID=A0ABR1SI04_9PEZI